MRPSLALNLDQNREAGLNSVVCHALDGMRIPVSHSRNETRPQRHIHVYEAGNFLHPKTQ